MKRVILVHGFNVKDHGTTTTDKLRPFFERKGVEVVEFDYGWRFLLGVRFLAHKDIAKLCAMVRPGDVGVGHSNGANYLHQASLFGAPFSQLCYINPALNADAKLAPQIWRCHVWYSPSDVPVKLSRLLPWHPWGDMGARGYKGSDKRYVNHCKEDQDNPFSSKKHSDVFKNPHVLNYWGPKIVDCLLK